jgi:hypothetical protein
MRSLVLAVSLTLVSCGSAESTGTKDAGLTAKDAGSWPKPGDPCTSENTASCEGGLISATALYCERGTLQRYVCSGPGACVSGSTRTFCDQSGAATGTLCPVAAEGTAVCRSSADAGVSHVRLQCLSGRFAELACPIACTVSSGLVYCD